MKNKSGFYLGKNDFVAFECRKIYNLSVVNRTIYCKINYILTLKMIKEIS